MVTPTKASATTTKRAPAKADAPVVPQMRYAAAVGLPTTINLPRWNDAGSVTAFGMTIITFALGILTMAHVTVPNNTSDTASTLAGFLGVAIAGGVQLVNYVRITVLHKAAIQAGVPVVTKTKVTTPTA